VLIFWKSWKSQRPGALKTCSGLQWDSWRVKIKDRSVLNFKKRGLAQKFLQATVKMKRKIYNLFFFGQTDYV
jgi:hypothetical protein